MKWKMHENSTFQKLFLFDFEDRLEVLGKELKELGKVNWGKEIRKVEYKVFKEYIFTSRKHDHKNQEQVQIGKNI